MKKRILSLLLFLTVIIAAIACGCSENKTKLSGSMTIVVTDGGESTKAYSVDLSAYTSDSTVEDALLSLSLDESNDFYYMGRKSQYGLFLTEAGYTELVHHDAAGGFDAYDETVYYKLAAEDASTYAYVAIYCNIENCYSCDYSSVTYEGKILGFSNFGVSGLPLEDNAVVYLTQG